jgi:acetoin utilization deacetylase AcuC-like enzyme
MTKIAVSILINTDTHVPLGNHPECPERLIAITNVLENGIKNGIYECLPIIQHGLEPIFKVHTQQYIESLKELTQRGGGHLEPDTFFSKGSFEAAISVVDASLSGVDHVMKSNTRRTFILGRPPGHHAESDHGMGFCLINNAAVAAQYAIDKYALSRVAIVDFDVHHGNGTQHMFYNREDVLFVSLHRYPFYPGTGSREETGTGKGNGFTWNIPLPAGVGDNEVIQAFEDEIVPLLDRFEPNLIIVSAGFDAYFRDPLGGMMLSDKAFFQFGALLGKCSDRLCDGRIVSILEGGYDNQGNSEAIQSYFEGLGQEE